MKSVKFGAILVIASLLAACAGVNFVRPTEDKLVLGKTTKNQIIAMLGEPNGKGQKNANGQNLEIINYAYAQVGAEPVFEGVTPARFIGFLFHNDVLVGKEFASSFKADNSYFDPQKAQAVKRGMTRSEVVALLGNPVGEHRHPVVSNASNKAIVYMFVQTKGFKSQSNVLTVELDDKDVVQKSDFTQTGQL